MNKMRVVFTFSLFFVMYTTARCEEWRMVDSGKFCWNDTAQQYMCIVDLPKQWTNNDPGDFLRIRIQKDGKRVFTLVNMDGWIDRNPEYSYSKSLSLNKHFVLAPITADSSVKAMILTGYGYASDASRLDIISLYNGIPELVATMEHFNVLKIEDLDQDSTNEVVGRKWLGEVYGKDNVFHSYCPFFVYRYVKKNDHWQFLFDVTLTRDYNKKHYYGWRGTNPREVYVVVHPKDGSKPRIMKEKEALEKYGSQVQDKVKSSVLR
jgi:hypothetical protein